MMNGLPMSLNNRTTLNHYIYYFYAAALCKKFYTAR